MERVKVVQKTQDRLNESYLNQGENVTKYVNNTHKIPFHTHLITYP